MNIKEALNKGIEVLKSSNIEAPVVEAGVMLCFALECDRVFLYTHSENAIDDKILERYLTFINLRAKGMPIQYITGHQEFMSLDFAVNSHVLIPRHDTEILVETVIEYVNGLYTAVSISGSPSPVPQVHILDIGTGSGCIAVSIAYYARQCRITAADISQKALETAFLNAFKNNVSDRIEFVRSNLFDSLNEQKFDVIVSNPPYIPSDEINFLQTEVRKFEPVIALDGGQDGLDFYRRIVDEAPRFLKPQGLLAFEVGCGQSQDVAGLMKGMYFDISIIKDLAGIERVVTGRLIK